MTRFLQKRRIANFRLSENTVLRVPKHVVVRFHQEGVVLLDSRLGLLFTGNRSAATIWAAIAQQQTIGAMAAQLSAAHNLSYDSAVEDVRNCARELRQRGLVLTEARG